MTQEPNTQATKAEENQLQTNENMMSSLPTSEQLIEEINGVKKIAQDRTTVYMCF